ncbi:MAG: flagellar biosynthetic protein FliO [Lachnospiraceae bacterium]|nr:flagellar biosynthetic protein FliO [Lachnospiraceae bacterium]
MFLIRETSGLDSIAQLICTILLFIFVLVLAYLAARITGSFQSNVLNKRSNIRVIEVFRLSNNKVIEIVKIGNQYLALAVCKDSVTVLTQLEETEINEQEVSLEPMNFKNILDKIKNEKKDHDKQK